MRFRKFPDFRIVFPIVLFVLLFQTLAAADLADRISRHDSRIFTPTAIANSSLDIRTAGTIASGVDDIQISETVSPASFTQENSSIAELSGDRVIVVWEDNRTGTQSIYGQIFGADGNPSGSNVQLAYSASGYNFIEPKAVTDGAGGFYLAWRVKEAGDIYAARFGSDLSILTPSFNITSNSGSSFAGPFNIDAGPSNKLIVVWERYDGGNFIALRVFNSSGSAISGVITVNDDGGTASHWVPDVAVSGTGTMMVVWEDYRNDRPDIMGQVVNSSGILDGSNFGLVDASFDEYNQFLPSVAFSFRDGFATAWLDNRAAKQDVYLQRFVVGLNLVGGNVKISETGNTYDNWDADLAVNSAYNLTAAWSTDESSDRIMARDFTTNFAISGAPFALNILQSGSRWSPALAFGQFDRIFCSWTDLRGGLSDIYLGYSTSSGTLLYPVDKLVNTDSQGANSTEPDIALAGSNISSVAFTDQRFDIGDVFVQLVDFGGNLVGASLKANTDEAGFLQDEPMIAATSSKIMVVWNDSRPVKGITGNRIFGRFLGTDGTWIEDDFLISDSLDVSTKRSPDVAMASDGSAMVVWEDYRNGTPHIYGRLFDGAGDTVGGEFAVSTIGADIDNEEPSVAVDGSDFFTVAWVERGNPGGTVADFARFNASGGSLGRFEYTADINVMDAAVNSDGEIYVLWTENSSTTDLYLTVLDNAGTVMNPDFPVTGMTGIAPRNLSVSVDNQSVALLTWTDARVSQRRAYYQLIAANYNQIGGNQVVTDFLGGAVVSSRMVGHDATARLVWCDNRSEGFSIYMRQIVYSTTEVGDDDISVLPDHFQLMQNYPNPFNPATTIRFSLPSRASVKLDIIDVLGRKVAKLADKVYEAGDHAIDWDGRDSSGRIVPSGVYLYRMTADGLTISRKMMLLK